MLQWMGGGRRKVKTTRKSIQARQHQFFEQRRQHLRSQAAEPDATNFDRFSQQQESIYSLDIASLKNLSRFAQHFVNDQMEGEFRKTVCPEGDAGNQNDVDLHCTGSLKNLPETTLVDVAALLRTTVGTQWTPASAAAAAALSHDGTGIFSQETSTFLVKALRVGSDDPKQEEMTLKIQPNPKQDKFTERKLLQKNAQQHKKFADFKIMDLISSQESEQLKNSSRSELYAAYVLEGTGKVPNCTPKNLKKKNDKVGPACKSTHGLPSSDMNTKRARGQKDIVHPHRSSVCKMVQLKLFQGLSYMKDGTKTFSAKA